jgi:hypothetical protein
MLKETNEGNELAKRLVIWFSINSARNLGAQI